MRRQTFAVSLFFFSSLLASCGAVSGGGAADAPNDIGEQQMAQAGNIRLAGPRPVDVIAAGAEHSCALLGDGTVRCWGYNGSGQLGTSTPSVWQTTPVQPDIAGAISIAAGSHHTCALLADGRLRCWGYNGYGQLGNLSWSSSTQPVPVVEYTGGAEITDAIAVAAGYYHSCAIRSNGTVWCWGYGSNYQLGNGVRANRHGAVQVQNLTDAVRVDGGTNMTCAVKSNGTAWCWGVNSQGALGDGSALNSLSPAPVQVKTSSLEALTHAVDLALDQVHACVVKSNGTVWCWGRNAEGQLGNAGVGASSTTAVQANLTVPGETLLATSVAATNGASCARTANGRVWCWGANTNGQLGDGTNTSALAAPVRVQLNLAQSEYATSVAGGIGYGHICAALGSGAVRCWGYNAGGQLGNGTRTNSNLPVPVAVDNVRRGPSVSGGAGFSCALRADGTARCWGNDGSGELGDAASRPASSTPVTVTGLTQAMSISAGYNSACALRADGTVWCWGGGAYGQIGDGALQNRTTPVQLGITNAVAVSVGMYHGCAVIADGTLQCWGRNSSGNLGDGTRNDRLLPTTVPGLWNITTVAAGSYHTCAIDSVGTARCWGRNDEGMVGDGTETYQEKLSPTLVALDTASRPVSITVGQWHSCALLANGSVSCWGSRYSSQLGDQVPTSSTLREDDPVMVANLTNAVALSTNPYGSTTCALRATGRVVCWGANHYGQCGTGMVGGKQHTPGAEVSGLQDAVALGVGNIHACALRANGTAVCWGENSYGSCGNGEPLYAVNNEPVPVPVLSFP
jgi:alpha-tubulin suppressor-like RCC1 family protein